MSATSKGLTPVSHNNFLLVEVPESGGRDYEIIRDQDNFEQLQLKFPSDTFNGLQNYSWVNLPPGNYSIVGHAKDLVGKSDYGDLLIYLVENDFDLNTTLVLGKQK